MINKGKALELAGGAGVEDGGDQPLSPSRVVGEEAGTEVGEGRAKVASLDGVGHVGPGWSPTLGLGGDYESTIPCAL
jgi:hypothetical protein